MVERTTSSSSDYGPREADLDHHYVLRVGQQTMIAEAPSSLCTGGATAYRRRQMASTRAVARVCSRARVTGVAFFDFLQARRESHRTESSFTRSSGSPALPAKHRLS